VEAHNIAAAVHSRRALLEVELRGARGEAPAGGSRVVLSLILGWGWGKWTCDL
jgi:hypothetical protein